MDIETIYLGPGPTDGSHHVTVYRFGRRGARPRVYIQGGLHADEAPGMLVGFALRDQLQRLEADGAVVGEILLVPAANPIGLAQDPAGSGSGRFDATSGQNFNRNFPDAARLALARDASPPEGDVVAGLRARMLAALDGLTPASRLEALQSALLKLAIGADIVIDMHCDSEAVTHLYCHSEHVEQAAALAQAVGAGVVLHAPLQGGASFDEACSLPWIAFRDRWPAKQVQLACFSVTLEWRGMLDTDAAMAENDAMALLVWLAGRGVLTAPSPRTRHDPAAVTPLAGVEVVTAPHPGLFLAAVPPGTPVTVGTLLGRLRCLPGGNEVDIFAGVDGTLYAREQARIVPAGAELFFIAGKTSIRTGMLLSA
ncbi:succinylglutamate desuccinylase/aspartoacylase family protein [Shinella sp. PSBB067]|uniref:succinylglutamate desuccinylase/aspartoacylase domain-containing protein n=1 Tax=Shinella sp. PSBB067 TaxID=2715959 RepID=UPI00193B901A|nr:succinylglutamate desuccinylase/aspartoacylase family protein [Shinella sp. PSBB067]QRI63785.1 succinylglutamate desuccinylase/aspartoacylase family protein [Shinella sp. PSBB067]